jgi:hypothetical protein
MNVHGVLQMQAIGKRLTRDQHKVFKQLRAENGFEELDTKAFLSLLRLLRKSGAGRPAAKQSDSFNYSIQRIQQ